MQNILQTANNMKQTSSNVPKVLKVSKVPRVSEKNTIHEIQTYVRAEGYFVNTRLNKNQLLDKVNAHIEYLETSYKFDQLDKVVLDHFAMIIPAHIVILFGNTCRRLKSILDLNYIWLKLCKPLPRFKEIHPIDLQRKQPEGFWKTWFKDNSPSKIISCPSYYARRKVRGDNYVETIYPCVGSILTKNNIDQNGILVTINFVCTEVQTLGRGDNKGLPKQIKIAPIVTSFKDKSGYMYHSYFRHDLIGVKVTSGGEIESIYEVLPPERYIAGVQ